jgi:hypothetical protein
MPQSLTQTYFKFETCTSTIIVSLRGMQAKSFCLYLANIEAGQHDGDLDTERSRSTLRRHAQIINI